jgi:hypothetical protein
MRIDDPMELKLNDVFFECQYGINLQMKVIKDPTFDGDRWQWRAVDSDGNEVDYLITKGLEHYGPRIYWQPAYRSFA